MDSTTNQHGVKEGRRREPAERPERAVRWSRWRRRLPRPETTLLIIGLLWTLGAKFAVVQRQADNLVAELVEAGLSDIIFFSAIALIFSVLYLTRWGGLTARLTLLASVLVLAWSVLNAAWLIATSVQLQPGVLAVLVNDPREFWPTVTTHLKQKLEYAIPIFATIVLAGVWFVWRLVRPVRVQYDRRRHGRCAALAGAVLICASIWQWAGLRSGVVAYSGEVIGFSSHWYAIVRAVSAASSGSDVTSGARVLPRAGERAVVPPDAPRQALPNVVVILLESVSYEATSLGDPDKMTTPNLVKLAEEGVQFASTRVPVSQTNKAFWTTLTGSMPDIQPDFVEAVLVDEPYESLASILARCGYRSAFFEMSKGSFECAPALFANLGFDTAWFRENLQDESAYLGYMNGDDFRMIEPMFEWVDRGQAPFLLVLITSVAHDPHVLPAWYPHEPKSDRYEQYLETVRYTDAFVGEVCDQLERRGLSDTTLLCVIGDHGETFRPESPRGRWTPFEETIRVPWVIRWPGRVEAGTRIDWPCSQLDVTPTILSLVGFGIDDAAFDGTTALEPIDRNRRLYFSAWYRNSPIGYVQGTRKLIYWPYTDSLFEYDLAADPGEESPRTINGVEKERAIAEIQHWQDDSRLMVEARRFRERVLYDHWRTFSSGRSAWAYYVP